MINQSKRLFICFYSVVDHFANPADRAYVLLIEDAPIHHSNDLMEV